MDIYAIVTEKIITLLEQGVVPWRRPWVTTGLPRNLISKKAYRGVNLFLLSASKFTSPFWLTLRQANQLGGHVRRTEERTLAVFWKVEESDTDSDCQGSDTTATQRRRFVLRYYRVFNLEQCELPHRILEKLPKAETREHEPIAACAEIVGCMPKPPEIVHGGMKAFYSPQIDRVTLPPPELFISSAEYYGSAFHELLHSTGHRSRLARKSVLEGAPFGSATYSFEELVSEMGAALLCAAAGISPGTVDNQAAYIAGWLKRLRDDRRLVIRAAAHAQQGADYVLGKIPTIV
jgi:antirestriction protein ArdC